MTPSLAGALRILEGLRVQSVTVFPLKIFIVIAEKRQETGDLSMRVFLACAIIITATLGLGGCFHHEQSVYAEPMAHPPLK
jgi:hypothetical protein